MTKLAMRATRALQKENGRRLLAREEFLTQDEIAELIDKETILPKLVEALAAALSQLDSGNAETAETSRWSDWHAVLAEANNPEVPR